MQLTTTVQGIVGQTTFHPDFQISTQADLTVTVSGVATTAYTITGSRIVLNTALVANSAIVMVQTANSGPASPTPDTASLDFAATRAANVTTSAGIGTSSDAAATSSGASGTAIAFLKGIFSKLASTLAVQLQAGTNAIGSITNSTFGSTIADGADVAVGAKADAAYTGSGSASVVAVLKGSYAALAAPTPTGSNNIGSVTGNSGTNLLNGSALAASSGSPITYQAPPVWASYFTARANSTQVGTLYIAETLAGGSGTNSKSVALAGGSSPSSVSEVSLRVSSGSTYGAYILNGATSATVSLEQFFTAN